MYIKIKYFIRIRLFHSITSIVSILLNTETTTIERKFLRMRRGTLWQIINRLL